MSGQLPLYVAAIKTDILKEAGLYRGESDSSLAVINIENSKWHVLLNTLRYHWEWIEIPEGRLEQPDNYNDYVLLALTTILTNGIPYQDNTRSDIFTKQIICTDINHKVDYDKLIDVIETSNETDLANEYTFSKQGNLRKYFYYDYYYGLDVLNCASYVICSHIEPTPKNIKQ